jgi:uncharacterized protein (DUF427 family)
MKAIWNGAVVADSDETVVVEGNHYFPESSLQRSYFQESATQTVCPWKGVASYYNLVVGDKVNADSAWFYPEPKRAASQISGHVAFWRGVEIVG